MAATELWKSVLINNTNLKFYGRFESGAETTDSSGNSHTLTLGNTPSGVAGKFGNGLQLVRASNQYAYAADHADFDMGTGVFSIGLWVKRSSTGNYMGLISSVNNSDQNGFQLAFQNTDVLIFNCADTTGNTATTTSTFTSTADYYFIVAVRDASFLRIYVNGKHEASAANTSKNTDSTSNLVFGAYRAPTLNANMLDGIIDDAFILKGTALSADQIKELYEGRMIGEMYPQKGMVLLHHFNGNSNDFSGSNLNGTDTNMSYSIPSGKYGQGASFSGTAHIALGNFGTLTAFTVSGWARMDANPVTQRCIHNAQIAVSSGKNLGISAGAGYVVGTTVWGTGTWYHFVITRSGTLGSIYVNGNLEGSGSVDAGLGSSQWLGGRADVGDNASYSWNGAMDEYAIFNYAQDATWARRQYELRKNFYV